METTQLNKFRQRRLRSLSNKVDADDKPVSSFYYPKSNLYNKKEYELLDTIYSDDPGAQAKAIESEAALDNFWPENKEYYVNLSSEKSYFLTKLSWFLAGVMLTSLVWFIYLQIYVHHIKVKNDTQIVFQNSALIMTDKNVDKEVKKALNEKSKINFPKFSLSRLFKPKSQVKKETPVINTPVTAVPETLNIKYHTISNGDSLWTIAKKYYSNPSPDNISKIADANNLKLTSTLQLGKKLVIPE